MKKMSKLLIALFLIISLFLVAGKTYAEPIDPGSFELGDSSQIDNEFAKEYGGKILSFFTGLSAVVAVVSLTYVGVKYITTGSIAQKADYKKDLIPIAIGVFMVSSITAILTFIAKIAGTF